MGISFTLMLLSEFQKKKNLKVFSKRLHSPLNVQIIWQQDARSASEYLIDF